MKNRNYTLAILITLTTFNVLAQNTKMVELKPIQVQGHKYFYDFSKVQSPYALQIPLQAVEDEEVNRRFKKFITFQYLRGIGYIASFVYIITAPSYQYADETFLVIFLSAIAMDISFNLAGHSQIKKAAERYNLLILPKKIGMKVNNRGEKDAWGLTLVHKF